MSEQTLEKRDFAAALIAKGAHACKCPWCATLPKIFWGTVEKLKGYYATCGNRACTVMIVTWPKDTPEGALELWNDRADITALIGK